MTARARRRRRPGLPGPPRGPHRPGPCRPQRRRDHRPRRGGPHGRPRLPARGAPDHGPHAARRPAAAVLRDTRCRRRRPRPALPHQPRHPRGRLRAVAGVDDVPPRLPRAQGRPLPVLVDLAAAPGWTVVFTRTTRGEEAGQAAERLACRRSSCTATSARARAPATWRRSTAARPRPWWPRTSPPAASTSTTSGSSCTPTRPSSTSVPAPLGLHGPRRCCRHGVTLMTAEQVDVRDLTRKAGIKPTTTRLDPSHPLLREVALGERLFPGGVLVEAGTHGPLPAPGPAGVTRPRGPEERPAPRPGRRRRAAGTARPSAARRRRQDGAAAGRSVRNGGGGRDARLLAPRAADRPAGAPAAGAPRAPVRAVGRPAGTGPRAVRAAARAGDRAPQRCTRPPPRAAAQRPSRPAPEPDPAGALTA